MQKWRRDIAAMLLITSVIFFFFLPLFLQPQKLLITPDFGKSDAWHFSFATKFALWESLHNGDVPLWNDKIGAGFPLYAEGQIGTFFVPTMVLFKFIPDPVLAYNLALVVTLMILGLGTYVWLRNLRIWRLPALFGSLTFVLSGTVILQLTHIALLQGFSLMPWFMALTQYLIYHPTRRVVATGALILSQQILAGFPQATFITLLLSSIWLLWHVLYKRTSAVVIFYWIVAVILGLGISAIQFIPSYEFLKQTSTATGFDSGSASYFSFPLKHLLSFINPFAFGDPKLGTYPHFAQFNGSIFWENTGYIGLTPFIFLLPLVFKRNIYSRFLLILLFVSLLLMWGSGSPLYIIYSFWPFNLFRVPSRFIWLFVFSLITLSSIGFTTILSLNNKRWKNIVFSMVAIVHIAILFGLWNRYHLYTIADQWLQKPNLLSVLPNNARIYSVGSEITHNQTFLSSGWQDPAPYETLKHALAADSNIVWKVNSYNGYAGRKLRRNAIVDSILENQLLVDPKSATISALAQNIIDLFGISHIISSVAVVQENVSYQKPIIYDQTDGLRTIRVYTNTTGLPRAYFADSTSTIESVEDALNILTKEDFQPNGAALVEASVKNIGVKSPSTVEIIVSEPTRVQLVTTNATHGLLVLSDTYYPGWNAYIDGKRENIIPTNIQSRGVLVPSGEHTVDFVYQPRSFQLGKWVSLVFLFLTVVIMVFPVLGSHSRIPPSIYQLEPYRVSSRGKPKPRTKSH